MILNLKEIKTTDTETKCLVGATVYKSVKDTLEDIANRNGVSLSLVIRTALNDLIDKETTNGLQ
jgi:hypothetical protein